MHHFLVLSRQQPLSRFHVRPNPPQRTLLPQARKRQRRRPRQLEQQGLTTLWNLFATKTGLLSCCSMINSLSTMALLCLTLSTSRAWGPASIRPSHHRSVAMAWNRRPASWSRRMVARRIRSNLLSPARMGGVGTDHLPRCERFSSYSSLSLGSFGGDGAGRNTRRPRDFYSWGNVTQWPEDQSRPIPPTLDSQRCDEPGFGAYDYRPEYDDLQDDIMGIERDPPPSRGWKSSSARSSPSPPPPVFIQMRLPPIVAFQGIMPDTATIPPSLLATNASSDDRLAYLQLGDREDEEESTSEKPDDDDHDPLKGFVEALRTDGMPTTLVNASQATGPALDHFSTQASSGQGATTPRHLLEEQLQQLQASIYRQNGDQEFNLNSPRQVAEALFGKDGSHGSTKKDVLEGMAAGGNKLASLLLEYRALHERIKVLARKERDIEIDTLFRKMLSDDREADSQMGDREDEEESTSEKLADDDHDLLGGVVVSRQTGGIPSTHVHAAQATDPALDHFLTQASSGQGATTPRHFLEEQLQQLQASIYRQNGEQEFNLNSPRQVAEALFGKEGSYGSTKKDVLEGMAAGGNKMASLLLEYRALHQRIQGLARKERAIEERTLFRGIISVEETDEEEDANDPLILVDASAYIFRAYYSMPPIHRSDGMPIGAVMGFCNMLNRIVLNRMLEGECPRLVLVFDAKGKTFRHGLYSDYKANRAAAPVDLIPQFDLVREAARAYGISQIEAASYEADDVIATLATMALVEGIDANIFSGDKDLMQLITEDDEAPPCIHMIDPMKMERITCKEVVEKWGVRPSLLGDVLALAGDTSDNVPGVPGIGPKIAAALLEEFGSLENLLDRVEDVKQQGRREKLKEYAAQARLSRVLVDLQRHVPREALTFPPGIARVRQLRMDPLDSGRLLAFYDQMGFRELKSRLKSRLEGVTSKRSRSSRYRRPKAEIPKPEDFSDVPF